MIGGIESRQVDWWSVHTFVLPTLIRVESWPLAGSPAWVELADNDPVKLAAIFDAARHHALRIDTAQAAMAQASRDIASAADWPAVGREIRQRNGVYIPREVA